METPILVALIGGTVTVVGFVISGLFGVLASANQRETAASLGFEKALNERLAGKEDQIAFLEKRVSALEAEKTDAENERDEAIERMQKVTLDAAERDQRWQKLLAQAKGEQP